MYQKDNDSLNIVKLNDKIIFNVINSDIIKINKRRIDLQTLCDWKILKLKKSIMNDLNLWI